MEHGFRIAAKVFGYVLTVMVALVVLIRGVVSPLWGSQSDLGLLGAILAFGVGILVILWVCYKFLQDLINEFNK